MCYQHKAIQKFIDAIITYLRTVHFDTCVCECLFCSSQLCLELKDNISSFMKHLLCPPAALFTNSPLLYYSWDCIARNCQNCWTHSPSNIFNCPSSNWDSNDGNTNLTELSEPFKVETLICCIAKFQKLLLGNHTKWLITQH